MLYQNEKFKCIMIVNSFWERNMPQNEFNGFNDFIKIFNDYIGSFNSETILKKVMTNVIIVDLAILMQMLLKVKEKHVVIFQEGFKIFHHSFY